MDKSESSKLKRFKVYFHRSKENNYEIIEAFGVDIGSKAMENLKHIGYEIETFYEVNTETGEHKLIGAEGFFLGSESYKDELDELMET